MKDPLPDTLSYHGVTFYGTVDVGYAYQDHGYAYSPYFYTGMNYAPHGELQWHGGRLRRLSGSSPTTRMRSPRSA